LAQTRLRRSRGVPESGELGYLLMWAGEKVRRQRRQRFSLRSILIEENNRYGERGFAMTLHSRLVAPYIGHLGTEEQKARILRRSRAARPSSASR